MTKDVRLPMSDTVPPRPDDPGFGEIRAQTLGVRLAVAPWELDAAQALRYRVFYDEMGAHPTPAMAATRRDTDTFIHADSNVTSHAHSDAVHHCGRDAVTDGDDERHAAGWQIAGAHRARKPRRHGEAGGWQ